MFSVESFFLLESLAKQSLTDYVRTRAQRTSAFIQKPSFLSFFFNFPEPPPPPPPHFPIQIYLHSTIDSGEKSSSQWIFILKILNDEKLQLYCLISILMDINFIHSIERMFINKTLIKIVAKLGISCTLWEKSPTNKIHDAKQRINITFQSTNIFYWVFHKLKM